MGTQDSELSFSSICKPNNGNTPAAHPKAEQEIGLTGHKSVNFCSKQMPAQAETDPLDVQGSLRERRDPHSSSSGSIKNCSTYQALRRDVRDCSQKWREAVERLWSRQSFYTVGLLSRAPCSTKLPGCIPPQRAVLINLNVSLCNKEAALYTLPLSSSPVHSSCDYSFIQMKYSAYLSTTPFTGEIWLHPKDLEPPSQDSQIRKHHTLNL